MRYVNGMARHPSKVLYAGERESVILNACEHYAGSEKLMLKALELQAAKHGSFDVTFDLEDGAPEGRETEHAELASTLAASEKNVHHRAGIRIHARNHAAWKRDVDIILANARGRLAYVTIPKATSAADVRQIVHYLREAEHRLKIERPTPVHVLIETHGALREVFDIASTAGVEVLDFGLMDFISDHHGAISADNMRSPGQFDHALVRRAKAEIAAAALAHGLVAAHNVTVDLKNKAQTFADAKRAKLELGFQRMWSIHPEQIDPILEAFRPDYSSVKEAAAILLTAENVDWAPVEHAGRLQDRASYRYHWELLKRARVAQMELDPEAERIFFSGNGS
jgi:citrate lyase subunit beta/citryl-CoA lyase